MKSLKKLSILSFFIFVVCICTAQNVVFSYSVAYAGATSTVSVYAQATSTTGNTFMGFASYLYYDNTKANAISINSIATTGAPYNWGTVNETSILHNPENNVGIPVQHTGYCFYQNFDNNFLGINMSTSPILLFTVTFNIISGNSNNIFLASTSQVPALAYSDDQFNPFPVVVIGNNIQALPLELLSLDVYTKQNKHANIIWATQHEINVKGFVVERSDDHHNWEPVCDTYPKGIENQKATYDLTDSDVYKEGMINTIFYYRLCIENLDGTKEYSPIKTARFNKSGQGIQVFPNPTQSSIRVDFNRSIKEKMIITLFDLNGKALLNTSITDSSSCDLELNSNISSGDYFLSIQDESGNVIDSKLISVQKN